MKKNVAGQRIGAQLVSATDGSAFTGSVTVSVCGDAGTQATGSVGSGACTHEGGGYHTYAPAQAETNFDLIAFTFSGTGAVPVTVQVFTRPTNDYASQDSVNTVDDFLDTEIASIKAKTDNLPTDPADASDIAGAFSTVNATLATIAGYLDTEVAAIKAKTDNLPTDPADASDIAASFSSIASTLSTIAAYIDTEVAAIKAKTDNLPADPADASDIASSFSSLAASLATLAGYVDTEVAAIKSVTDKLDTAMELDSTVYRFTVNALEQAPSGGGGGSTDWTADERTAIRTILGVPASGTTPDVPSAGALKVIDDFLDTEVAAIKAKTDLIPSDPADASDIAGAFSTVNSTLAVIAGYIDTEVAAIKVTTDRISGMLIQDGAVYQFTVNALENGPQGSGGGGGGDATLAKQNEILALLGTGSAISNSPVSSNGEIEYGVVRGDDYLSSSGRAFQWDVDVPAGIAYADATCQFGGSKLDRGSWLVTGTIEEVEVNSVPKWRLKFQPRSADTVNCIPDQNYFFTVAIVGPSERITRVYGWTEVLDSRTLPE